MANDITDIVKMMETNWPECAETVSPALLRLLQVSNLCSQQMETLVGSHELQRAEFGE